MSNELTWHWYNFDEMPSSTLYQYLKLRQDVFIIGQKSIYSDLDDMDQTSQHLLGFDPTGKLATCLRLLPPDQEHAEPHIGRVIVAPEFRGHQLAHALIKEGIKHTRELYPDAPIRIGAQSYLKDFYANHGFKPLGAPYDDCGVEHIDMILAP